jgi:hypothetical protein
MEWDVSLCIKKLPERVRVYFNERAEFLHRDLLFNRYKGDTYELPYKKDHPRQKGVLTENYNPLWYSKFYWKNTPHFMGKNGPRRKLGYETLRKSRFEKSLELVANSKDRDLLKYDTLAREITLHTLIHGVDARDGEFCSLIDKVSFEMMIEPVNEVRKFFGENGTSTYRDELIEFQREYGEEEGEVRFFTQYDSGRNFCLNEIPF